MYTKEAKLVLHGKAAIEPIGSPLEAEAEALRMAISRIKRLGFDSVIFCGDSARALQTTSTIQRASYD